MQLLPFQVQRTEEITNIYIYIYVHPLPQVETYINRVREIAYGFGGPSEKNVSPH